MSAPTVAELRAKVTEKGPWFDVPAATRVEHCRSCRTDVFWIRTAAGKAMPVDCDVPGGKRPERAEPDLSDDGSGRMYEPADGRGVSHFATCPQSPLWRNKR